MMGIGKRLWYEIKEPIFACGGLIICFGGVSIILEIIYRHWSWGWWFLVSFLFLIGLFLICFPITAVPIIFKAMKKNDKR